MRKYSLGKEEKIKHSSIIKKILQKGAKNRESIFDCYYLKGNSNKTAIIVPKKKIKLATNRNIIKRRIRESYRLNKYLMTDKNIYMVFFYKSTEIKPFKDIEVCMIDTLLFLSVMN